MKEGRFREDLFYRLNVFPIAVPALRERSEDVPELVRHFLLRFAAEEGKRIRLITGEALDLLRRHSWPGNVRQLENAVFRAVVLAEADAVGVAEFPQIAAQVSPGPEQIEEIPPHEQETVRLAAAGSLQELMVEDEAPTYAPMPAGDGSTVAAALRLLDSQGQIRPLDEIESEVIRFAISHYRGQMSAVARRLQIGRSTLYRKLEHLGLSGSESDGELESVAAK